MDRVYLFKNGDWCWSYEYSSKAHARLGNYKEIILGEGWHDREVSKMLHEFHEENLSFWED